MNLYQANKLLPVFPPTEPYRKETKSPLHHRSRYNVHLHDADSSSAAKHWKNAHTDTFIIYKCILCSEMHFKKSKMDKFIKVTASQTRTFFPQNTLDWTIFFKYFVSKDASKTCQLLWRRGLFKPAQMFKVELVVVHFAYCSVELGRKRRHWRAWSHLDNQPLFRRLATPHNKY